MESEGGMDSSSVNCMDGVGALRRFFRRCMRARCSDSSSSLACVAVEAAAERAASAEGAAAAERPAAEVAPGASVGSPTGDEEAPMEWGEATMTSEEGPIGLVVAPFASEAVSIASQALSIASVSMSGSMASVAVSMTPVSCVVVQLAARAAARFVARSWALSAARLLLFSFSFALFFGRFRLLA